MKGGERGLFSGKRKKERRETARNGNIKSFSEGGRAEKRAKKQSECREESREELGEEGEKRVEREIPNGRNPFAVIETEALITLYL